MGRNLCAKRNGQRVEDHLVPDKLILGKVNGIFHITRNIAHACVLYQFPYFSFKFLKSITLSKILSLVKKYLPRFRFVCAFSIILLTRNRDLCKVVLRCQKIYLD